jgi:hypothetical protein
MMFSQPWNHIMTFFSEHSLTVRWHGFIYMCTCVLFVLNLASGTSSKPAFMFICNILFVFEHFLALLLNNYSVFFLPWPRVCHFTKELWILLVKNDGNHYLKWNKPGTEKKCHMISLICGIFKNWSHRSWKWNSEYQRLGRRDGELLISGYWIC